MLNASSSKREFFWLETVDGKSVVINLADVQAVRFLWDMVPGPPDLKRHDGPIQIQLRGRTAVLEADTEDVDELFDLYSNLQIGSEDIVFPGFTDGDGELLQLNASHVVWVIAPTHMLNQGERAVAKRDGLTTEE